MSDLICRYILRDEHPSYYAFVLDGETTLGEYWAVSYTHLDVYKRQVF